MSIPSRRPMDTAWVLRLRTASVVGILLLVLIGRYGVQLDLPMPPLLAILGIWVATNAAVAALSARRRAPLGDDAIAGLMALDAVFMTGVFYLTGGPSNPFNFLFLVHIALASVALPPRHAWGLAGLAVVLFGLLFVDSVPLSSVGHAGHGGHDLDLHLRGMWVGFVLAAAAIITFSTRVTRQLAARERDLAQTRARAEQMAAMATMAAGAAHELATPLSTIAVVASELVRDLSERPGAEEAAEDARLIHDQVGRCRTILDHLRIDAGEPGGEAPQQATAEEVWRAAVQGVPAERLHIEVDPSLTTPRPFFVRSLAMALRGLVRNALDATSAPQTVRLRAVPEPGGLAFEVIDEGTGMDEATLRRVGEPFYTTKPTGQGMGLGVFLARAVAERMGGRLEFTSRLGAGTRAALHLPETTEP